MNVNVLIKTFNHAKFVDDNLLPGYKRAFTVLIGSQNYGLSDENSDVDTYSFVIPNFNKLVFDEERYSNQLNYNDEHATIKDCRAFANPKFIASVSNLEMLFTEYVDICSCGEDLYKYLVYRRDDIANCYIKQTVLSMCGQFFSLERQIVSNGSQPNKQLARAFRIQETLKRYCEGYSFDVCLNLSDCRDKYFAMKNGDYSDIRAAMYSAMKTDVQEIFMKWECENSRPNMALIAEIKNELFNLFQKECK